MIVTVFLSVLILALAMGNAFLSVTSPSKIVPKAKQDTGKQGFVAAGKLRKGQGSPGFESEADAERMRMLHKRIDRLESLLLRINNTNFVAQKLNGTNLVQKLNGFEEFKQNTKLEIEALKQQLSAVKKDSGIKAKPREEIPDVPESQLHDLIFHSAK